MNSPHDALPLRQHRPVKTRAVPARHRLPGDLPVILQRLYAARGLTEAAETSLALASLVPVSRFDAIPAAVARLMQARAAGERLVCVSDFDADGCTGAALLMRGLTALGFEQHSYVIPDRFRFGYGLSPAVVEHVAALHDPRLIVTVDNGIAAIEGVAAAQARGIEVLVTDHHLPGERVPDCLIVNPSAPGESFPHKNLAGVGVVFYLLAALARELELAGEVPPNTVNEVPGWLDIVAVGTVADVVPLDQNNRILVNYGLELVRQGRCRPGITALLKIAKCNPANAVATDFGFRVGPRLNSAGRLADMTVGVECLLTDSTRRAAELAAQLDALNIERRVVEGEMNDEAAAQVNEAVARLGEALPLGLTVYGEQWHSGVVGLVASRLKERYHRPVIAFAPGDNGMLKGSGRSVPGLHMRDALAKIATDHPGLIPRMGGHAMAAGLSLPVAHLPAFEQAFAAEAARWLAEDDVAGAILTDGTLDASLLDLETAELLEAAGPWGQGFEEPKFHGRFRVLAAREVGTGHLRMDLLPQGGERPLAAIAFNLHAPWPEPGETIDIVYKLTVNEWREVRTAQIMVEHMQPPQALAEVA